MMENVGHSSEEEGGPDPGKHYNLVPACVFWQQGKSINNLIGEHGFITNQPSSPHCSANRQKFLLGRVI